MIAKTILDQFFARAEFGPFEIDYWGSERKRYGAGEPRFTLNIHDEGVIGEIVKRADLGFGEAYMDDRLDVDHMDELLRFANVNQATVRKVLGVTSGYRFARNVKRNQAHQIASHYDIGNDFYKLWLDDTMTYTCAY